MDPAAHYGVRGTGTPGGRGGRDCRRGGCARSELDIQNSMRIRDSQRGGTGTRKPMRGEDLTVHRKLGSFGIRLSR